jgi:hypothetical protein
MTTEASSTTNLKGNLPLKPTRKPKKKVMTDEEIKALALQAFRGEIFTSDHVHKHDANLMTIIFLPLGFMEQKQLDEMRKDVGMIYAPMADALSRSINGYPCFTSMRYISREEYRRFVAKYHALTEAVKGV